MATDTARTGQPNTLSPGSAVGEVACNMEEAGLNPRLRSVTVAWLKELKRGIEKGKELKRGATLKGIPQP